MAKTKTPAPPPARPRGRPPLDNRKESVTLRIDPETLAYLRANFETTIGATVDAILANYVKRRQRT